MSNNLLTSLLTAASTNWGLDEADIREYINKIAFHESKNNPKAIQILDDGSHGRGRGLYQYEIDENNIQGGAHTAVNRLINYNERLNNKFDISFTESMIKNNSYDFSNLTEEEQLIMFLVDKLEDKTANMGKYDIDGNKKLSNKELAGFHADEHWAGYEGVGTLTPTKKGKIERDDFIQKLIKDYQSYKP